MTRTTVLAGLVGLAIGAAGTFAAVSLADDDTVGRQRGASDTMSRIDMSGEMHRMTEQHADMLKEMRQDMTPRMRDRMDDDVMSEMMMSGEMLEMMEEHQLEMGGMHR